MLANQARQGKHPDPNLTQPTTIPPIQPTRHPPFHPGWPRPLFHLPRGRRGQQRPTTQPGDNLSPSPRGPICRFKWSPSTQATSDDCAAARPPALHEKHTRGRAGCSEIASACIRLVCQEIFLSLVMHLQSLPLSSTAVVVVDGDDLPCMHARYTHPARGGGCAVWCDKHWLLGHRGGDG